MVLSYQKDLELFRRHPYRQKRLKSYFAQMSKDDNRVLVDDNVKDALLAQGFSTEESPRSIYTVEKLYEALALYAPKYNHHVKASEEFSSGVALAFKCFARGNRERLEVMPMCPSTIVAVTSNPSGSPGLTNYGCSKAESMTRALERGLQILRGEKQPEPCLAFKRTQFNGKTRLVWGYPYSMTVIEGLVAKPLLDQFKKGGTPMAFAMKTGMLGTKLRVASYHKEWAYSLDMSSFDATLSSDLIHIAFKILKTWFDLSSVESHSGKSVGEIFQVIENYFVNTTIVMPDGNIYYGKNHGVPSGSYFTQMVDSIVNVIIGGTISARYGMHVSSREIFVLGDDLLMWSNRAISLNVISKYANEVFKVKLHGEEKSKRYHFDESLHYLGRDWENGMPTLSESEILKRMIYPEKFRHYPEDPAKRERQVHMLLLAYASTYRAAWRIASRVIDPNQRNIACGGSNIDVNVYLREGGSEELDPDVLSGLLRFRRKYVLEKDRLDIPLTALQYWL